jgi:hypothetical protein
MIMQLSDARHKWPVPRFAGLGKHFTLFKSLPYLFYGQRIRRLTNVYC